MDLARDRLCQTKPIKIERIFMRLESTIKLVIPRTLYIKRRVKMPMYSQLQTPELVGTWLQVPRQRYGDQK